MTDFPHWDIEDVSEDLHGRIDELIAERDTFVEYTKHLIAERDELDDMLDKTVALMMLAEQERDEARRIARRLLNDPDYYYRMYHDLCGRIDEEYRQKYLGKWSD